MLMAAILFKWLWFPLIALSWASPSSTGEKYHPFYVSVTEINHNAAAKTLEISCKMFSEDIEQILEKNYRTTLDITEEKDRVNFDKYLPDYMTRHLGIVVDGKPVRLNYVGYELDKESAWCYFEVENVNAAKKLDITNSILHDFTNEQINIMHVTINGNRKSTKMNYPDKNTSLAF